MNGLDRFNLDLEGKPVLCDITLRPEAGADARAVRARWSGQDVDPAGTGRPRPRCRRAAPDPRRVAYLPQNAHASPGL